MKTILLLLCLVLVFSCDHLQKNPLEQQREILLDLKIDFQRSAKTALVDSIDILVDQIDNCEVKKECADEDFLFSLEQQILFFKQEHIEMLEDEYTTVEQEIDSLQEEKSRLLRLLDSLDDVRGLKHI